MRASRLLLALLVAILVLPEAGAVRAGDSPRPPRRVRVETPPGGSILVHGEYPQVSSSCVDPTQPVLHERYRGAVEVVLEEDGSLSLLGELPFEDYLKGIAEVPRSWHLEALKAQVVAARSYAATRLDPGGSYDLCATDACQVYMGMGVERGAFGERWVRAVEETAGEVLLWDGRPAQTFYFSTSNGRTYTNQDVWGTPKLPYLERTRERDDGESPLSRWRVEVRFDDLATFLAADGRWSGPVRSVRVRGGTIVVRGGGDRVGLTPDDLRDALNDTARCLMPERYPTREPDGYRLPQPVPSHWFRASVKGDTLVLQGRGWGHGIGMVQWGAKGKADRGLSYGDILAAYYGGLRPAPTDLPGTIRVLLATGLRSVTLDPEGDARVRARGGAPDPPLRVRPRNRGLRIRETGPPAPELEVRRPRASLEEDGRVSVRLRSETPVRVRVELAAGGITERTSWRSFEAGRIRTEADLPEEIAGDLRVLVRVTDGVDTIRVPITTLSVAGRPGSPSPPGEPPGSPPVAAGPTSSRGEPPSAFPLAVMGAVLILLVLAGLLVLRAGGRKRFDSPDA